MERELADMSPYLQRLVDRLDELDCVSSPAMVPLSKNRVAPQYRKFWSRPDNAARQPLQPDQLRLAPRGGTIHRTTGFCNRVPRRVQMRLILTDMPVRPSKHFGVFCPGSIQIHNREMAGRPEHFTCTAFVKAPNGGWGLAGTIVVRSSNEVLSENVYVKGNAVADLIERKCGNPLDRLR